MGGPHPYVDPTPEKVGGQLTPWTPWLCGPCLTVTIFALHKCCPLQVDAWLQKVFTGDSVPAYEVSEQTLDLLLQLKQTNEHQENYNQRIIQDMQLKTDEYRAEGIILI